MGSGIMRLALVIVVVSAAVVASAAQGGDVRDLKYYKWDWGSDADVAQGAAGHIVQVDRVGQTGADGATTYRELMPGVFQVGMVMPAFDFDADNYGAINHPFYMTVRFKDIAGTPVQVYAGKGGCGFYGAGWVGQFGGAGDGAWKEESVIIPRSMMRCQDGKTFRFAFTSITAAVPVDSVLLASADAKLPEMAARCEVANAQVTTRREAERQRLLPQFRDLGLPEPGESPAFTDAEKERAFRVFFPPVSRQLFANSVPFEGELAESVSVHACPGQSETLVVAVRALRDLGHVTVRVSLDAAAVEAPAARWALYSEQRIGSSWGKDYRVCPEQLAALPGVDVKPDRLEIATVTLAVGQAVAAGQYRGTVDLTSAKGGNASIPLTLTVYPFRLADAPHGTHGQFYYAEGTDSNPLELADMRRHGMNTLVSSLGPWWVARPDGHYDVDAVRPFVQMLKDLGYVSPLVVDTGNLGKFAEADTPENRAKYVGYVTETLAAFREAGFGDTAFFPVDEPHPDSKLADPAQTPIIQKALRACTWIREVPGAKTFITSNPTAARILEPVLDDVCYNLAYINEANVSPVRASGGTLMFYCPSIDVNPEYNRYRPGYYMFKLGAYASYYFAYMEFAGDPWLDLDGPHRDWNVVYPSMTSPRHDPTLEWEAMREGVDDYRYLATLSEAIASARRAGRTEAADKAQRILDEVLAPIDTNGEKAGGPAIGIEANVALKDRQLSPEELRRAQAQMASSWYDDSRRKVAEAIIPLTTNR